MSTQAPRANKPTTPGIKPGLLNEPEIYGSVTAEDVMKHVKHEANEVHPSRQPVVNGMDPLKRCFTLATASDPAHKAYRKASDGTIYKKSPGGTLVKVSQEKPSKKERAKQKRLLKRELKDGKR